MCILSQATVGVGHFGYQGQYTGGVASQDRELLVNTRPPGETDTDLYIKELSQ